MLICRWRLEFDGYLKLFLNPMVHFSHWQRLASVAFRAWIKKNRGVISLTLATEISGIWATTKENHID